MKYIISAAAILLANGGAFALPQGGRIEAGKGNLDNPAHIIQESQHLQTRWNSFDIATKEQVRIEQPNAQSSINIKVSAGGGGAGGATTINGTLTANGRVSLENPAGIQFGKNSVVNVGGLLASSAKGAVTSLGQVRAAEVVRFQGLSSKNIVNVGGAVSAQEIIVESNGDIVIGNSAHFTASKQVLIGGGYQGKNSAVLNARTTDVKAAAHITAPRVIVWADKVTRFLGRINAGRGFVEVSGKQHLIFPDISRVIAGTLLLDPANLIITSASASSLPFGSSFEDFFITNDGLLEASDGGSIVYLTPNAIQNYNGNVILAATQIVLTANTTINKSNGFLSLAARVFTISGTIIVTGGGNYLSFVLTGVSHILPPFSFGANSSITTDDLRLDRNYTDNFQVEIPSIFAAPGRKVTINAPSSNIGRVLFTDGFNLCQADNTRCGDLTIDVGTATFTNTNNTIRAKSINITVGATQGIISNNGPLDLHAYDGGISITATGGGGISSSGGHNFNFSASDNIAFRDVAVEIGSGTIGITAGVGTLSTGNITLAGSSFNTLSSLSLSQDGAFFPVTRPFLSSSAPVTATYRGSGTNPPLTWATLIHDSNLTAGNINVSDGDLTAALDGKFDVSPSGTLDLGSANLTADTLTLVVPHAITTITTTGTINITSGLSRGAMLTLTADTIVLGGTVAVGLENQLFLNSPNPITASSNLRIEAVIFLNAPSLGSAGFDLWIFTFLAFGALELLGNDITINGNGAAAPHPLTIKADNDIILEGAVSASTLILEAKAGGVIFSTVDISGASRIEITQADPYVVSAAATFSTKPILNSANRFNRPSWGVCGKNCFEIVPADVVIPDGDLLDVLIGKFDVVAGTLDLGSFNLTATTTTLVVPSHIRTITTRGTISITSGLTASAPLSLTAGTFAFGGAFAFSGTFTASNILTLNSANPITASSALTISAPLIFAAPSLGSASIDLTLAEIISSSALELLGSNITLGGVVVVFNNSSLTVTADNDLAVNGNITADTLSLAATAGGITFASTSTAITANSIELTQANPYVVFAPATFSTAPTLNRPTNFIRPSWGICGMNCAEPVPADLLITDGGLAAAIVDKFDASSGTLDLGSANLTAHTKTLVVPSHIHTITTTGTISIASGLSKGALLTLTADTIVLGRTVTVGLENQLFLNSPNPITASSNLRIEAVIFLDAPSLGSADFDLWTFTFLTFRALELLGKNITINGNGSAAPRPLTITAKNDIILEGAASAGTLILEAQEGGVIFSTVAINASRVEITQADPYVVSAAATFSTTPILNSATRFNRPSWGICGTNTNCLDPIDLVITDGALGTAIADRFDVFSGTLDLGSFNLTANTVALDIPSHILTITTTGTISITSGLTASAPLSLTADMMAFGGIFTTGTNIFTLTSSKPITASSDLTINSPLALSAPSFGSAGPAGFDLTLAAVTSSTALTLLGENIQLLGAVIANNFALTITAANDLEVRAAITATTLALIATAGGITFASSSTAITANSIELTQANPYVVFAPATFSTAPTLNRPTNFIRPFWGVCGMNCAEPVPTDLLITDGDLAAALVGKFDSSSGTLDLGSFNLTANSIDLDIPSYITTITTMGTISIASGLIATAPLSLTAGTFALGGIFTADTNALTLNSANSITASSALTINSPLALGAPSLGSVDANLTLAGISIVSAVELLGDNIQLGGAVTVNSSALTITADNDIAVGNDITVGALALIATAGGITFSSSKPAITAATIELTQTDPYVVPAPAAFSTPPTLNRPTNFIRPFWGFCGTNCTNPVPTDLLITDGNLADAIVNKFDSSSGTLDLGSFNLTAHTAILDIPPSITTIRTMGTISIANGLTATAPAAALSLTANTFVFGGTFTAGANTLMLTSANPITASSALTINSLLGVDAPSLGSASIDLTLANISIASALYLRGSNIRLGGVVTANSSALTITADNDIAVGGDITVGALALTATAGSITFASTSTTITAATIALTQTDPYVVLAPAAFSIPPTLNRLITFNRPSWGACGTNCLDPGNLVITDGSLVGALVDKFEVSGNTLDLGSFDLTADTIALVISRSILTITTTGTISIASGLITSAPINLNAGMIGLGGILTTGTDTLTLTSANPITANSALTISSPVILSAPSLGSVGVDLILAGISIASAVELLGKNITLFGVVTVNSSALTITADNDIAVSNAITVGALALTAKAGGITFATTSTAITGSTIELTQANPYVATAPATFSTSPTLNRPSHFNRPSWGLCGTNCLEPANLVITDGKLAAALVDKFVILSGTLDLGNFNLTAHTIALDIPSGILSITTTGMISIASGLTATAAAAALTLTAGTIGLGGILTTGTDTLTLASANPITASSALMISSPLVVAAPSVGSAGVDLTLAGVTSSSALELLGANITLGGVVSVSGVALTVTAANDIAVSNDITAAAGTLALEAAAGGITFATTSTAITASTIELTQADPYVANAPATFSTPPTLNRPIIFNRPFWGSCGTNCLDPVNLVIADGDLGSVLVGKFEVSGNTLDLGSLNLVAHTIALDIPSHILSITTTGMISIRGGLTATAALTLTAGTFAFGGILTADTNTLTLNSANPITANSALTINSPLTMAAPSLGSAGFDLTLAGVTSPSALELRGANITLGGVVSASGAALTITAANDIVVNNVMTATTLALTATTGGITFATTSTAITAVSIELTQADPYVATAPATFSTAPTLNRPTNFNRPSWGLCGTNCFDPTNLFITDGSLATALVGKFDISSGTLDLGAFNLTADTTALVVPSHIRNITTTGTISIASGLTATAPSALNLSAGTIGLRGILTTGTNTLTLNSANPITASSALTINSPLVVAAPSLGSAGFDLTLAGVTSSSALELLGANITLGGVVSVSGAALTITAANDLAVNNALTAATLALEATAGGITFATSKPAVTGSAINLTQADPYVATEPATFSTAPTLNSSSRFTRLVWGLCGTNCLGPGDIVVTDGDLATALVGRFSISGNTLDLGSFSLIADTTALDIPSGILSITTTGMISITGGLTATAATPLSLTAGTMVFGGILTIGSDTLMLNSANPITASSALTVNSPLVVAAPSLGSAGVNLTLASITSSSALELLGANITLGGVVTINSAALTITAANDIAVNDAITAATLALEATAGGITFAATSTAVTAATINLTQADPYVVNAPATFSTTPILNSLKSFTRPAWGSCGTNCFGLGNLVVIDGSLAAALVGRFSVSGNTLDLGSFNLIADTIALIIPSHITTITTTGTISITSGLTATASLTLNADTMAFGGTFTVASNTLTLTSANAITASSALTINSPLVVAAPSLGTAGFDLTFAANITSSSALALRGNNIRLGGVVSVSGAALTVTAANDLTVSNAITAGTLALEAAAGGITFANTSTAITAATINLTQTDPYVATAPATFSTPPTLNNTIIFSRPSWGLCGTNCLNPANLVITDGNLITALVDKFQVSGNTLDLGSFNLTVDTIALVIPSHIRSITTTGTISIANGLTATAGLVLNAGAGLTISGSWELAANALDLTTEGAIAFNSMPAITASKIELTQTAAYDAMEPATFSTTPILNSPTSFTRPSWGSCGTNCLNPQDMFTSAGMIQLLGNDITLSGTVTVNSFALTIPAGNDIAVNNANGWQPCSRDADGQNYFCYQ